ncbi:uncharacterized protein CLUP02_07842 [Colletotrichum lupini]|uniref:Uncharacterized protein n=1 Tax=Colletotrichum lupini TaxID=145971 RepID=A0A9Q8SRR9_9PEZI|nr:uncharacterized protein CLUP02_07842 [Colletotrichum lupini]UQC82354.1 hypothetical protein CLUP02_07842 [Colletotrichum lupini]
MANAPPSSSGDGRKTGAELYTSWNDGTNTPKIGRDGNGKEGRWETFQDARLRSRRAAVWRAIGTAFFEGEKLRQTPLIMIACFGVDDTTVTEGSVAADCG